jgi:hypothetical protein
VALPPSIKHANAGRHPRPSAAARAHASGPIACHSGPRWRLTARSRAPTSREGDRGVVPQTRSDPFAGQISPIAFQLKFGLSSAGTIAVERRRCSESARRHGTSWGHPFLASSVCSCNTIAKGFRQIVRTALLDGVRRLNKFTQSILRYSVCGTPPRPCVNRATGRYNDPLDPMRQPNTSNSSSWCHTCPFDFSRARLSPWQPSIQKALNTSLVSRMSLVASPAPSPLEPNVTQDKVLKPIPRSPTIVGAQALLDPPQPAPGGPAAAAHRAAKATTPVPSRPWRHKLSRGSLKRHAKRLQA